MEKTADATFRGCAECRKILVQAPSPAPVGLTHIPSLEPELWQEVSRGQAVLCAKARASIGLSRARARARHQHQAGREQLDGIARPHLHAPL
eukprot:scaffold26114_cov121-Isochrysis_galbana.AAC.1